jgi:hypothetical protein
MMHMNKTKINTSQVKNVEQSLHNSCLYDPNAYVVTYFGIVKENSLKHRRNK